MALRKLGEDLYLYPGSPSTMIKIFEGKAFLIDPGNGSKRHKDLRREVRKIGVEIKFLLATHGHADHISIVPRLEKPLFVHRFEFSVVESPLNRELLTFGSKAPKGFLVYQFEREVKAHAVFEWGEELFGLKTLKLNGHSPGMTGFLDEDNGVLYAGDSFFGERLIRNIGVPYLVDVQLFKNSITQLKNYVNDEFLIIPSHGRSVKGEEALEILDFNLKRIEETEEKILKFLKEPLSISELSYRLANDFGVNITPQALALNQVPIRAFIAELYNSGKIEAVVEGDLKWRRI